MAYEDADKWTGKKCDTTPWRISEQEQPAMQKALPEKKRGLPRKMQRMEQMGA